MPNRYAATCYRCGETVPPGEGVFEKISQASRKKWPRITGKWHVQHHLCADKYRRTRRHYIHCPGDDCSYCGDWVEDIATHEFGCSSRVAAE